MTTIDCSSKTVVSLFDFTGNWALPYAEAGADVIYVDLKRGQDVGAFTAEWLIFPKDVARFLREHTAQADLSRADKFWLVDLLSEENK